MTWPRVRTWIGQHPALAVNLTVLACLVVFFAAAMGIEQLWDRDNTGKNFLSLVAVPFVLGFAVSAATAWIGCLLGRAGQRPSRVLRGLVGLPPMVGVWFVAGAVAESLITFGDLHHLGGGSNAAVVITIVTAVLAVLVLSGWFLADGITHYKIHSGQWERIEPADDVRRKCSK